MARARSSSFDAEATADDRDLSLLLSLGCSLATVEQLWGDGKASRVRAAAERLTAARSQSEAADPIHRHTGAGLELFQNGSVDEPRIQAMLDALSAEDDEPPERFRDPIMLTLMSEPMVLSSGHTFDKATIYDDRGHLRFTRCPLTREAINQVAYPLVSLKRELIEWKLRRLDGILDAAAQAMAHAHAHAHAQVRALLPFAKRLLDTLRGRYIERTQRYWSLRAAVCADDVESLVELLDELMRDLPATACAAAAGGSPLAARCVEDLLDEKAASLWRSVKSLPDERPDLAAPHACACSPSSQAMAAMATALARLEGLSGRASWVSGCVGVMERFEERCEGADERRVLLANHLDRLRPPPISTTDGDAPGAEAHTLRYWELRLRVCTSAAEELRQLARMSDLFLRGSAVVRILVSGAGVEAANGEYVRDGEFAAAPVFKHPEGRWWMIRYRLPNGSFYWYIADRNRLDTDAGDLYRVKTRMLLPPCDMPWGLARDGVEPPPTLTCVHASVAHEGSRLALLFAEHKQRLQSKGVDVSGLEARPQGGTIARIGGRVGDYVDQVTLTRRGLGATDSALELRYGGNGGRSIQDFALDFGEVIVGIQQWTGPWLGSRLRFRTSEGRSFDITGGKHAERERDLSMVFAMDLRQHQEHDGGSWTYKEEIVALEWEWRDQEVHGTLRKVGVRSILAADEGIEFRRGHTVPEVGSEDEVESSDCSSSSTETDDDDDDAEGEGEATYDG